MTTCKNEACHGEVFNQDLCGPCFVVYMFENTADIGPCEIEGCQHKAFITTGVGNLCREHHATAVNNREEE